MAKRKSLFDALPAVEASVSALTRQAQAHGAGVPNQRARLALDAVLDRHGGDTRPLAQPHVDSLADSIAAVGLIQPVVVDRFHRILAGAHRRAALQLWRQRDAAAYAARYGDGIPVHIYDLDAAADPERALAIEITENEKRRDYTKREAIAMAERLQKAGFSYRPHAGAPRAGERMLIPVLAVMIGKSEKTIRRYLHGALAEDASSARKPANLDNVQIRRAHETLLNLLGATDTRCSQEDARSLRAAADVLERLLHK